MDIHDYRLGKGRRSQRLWKTRQRHQNKEEVNEILSNIDALDAKLAEDIPTEMDIPEKEQLLAGLDSVDQQSKFQARNHQAVKGVGIWMLTRPVWQLSAALAGLISYIILRRKK